MQQDFTLEAYDFNLPDKNIAQKPAEKRDNSRLLVINRNTSKVEDKHFSNIVDYISPGDLLIVNDTKVFPARLTGKKETGGKVEIFLLEYPVIDLSPESSSEKQVATAPVLIKSSKRPKVGSTIYLNEKFHCTILEQLEGGKAIVALYYSKEDDLALLLDECGQVPLPPYIARNEGSTEEDKTRYQTVYANQPGAVAAPTAGLHFTEELLCNLQEKGVATTSITLHVGYGTFAPVREDNITAHTIHEEYISVSPEVVEKITATKKRGGKVWAVGTTTVRALEFAAKETEVITPTEGWCNLYILPGYTFKVVDHLITNFHLPKSSLLFLVSALCGREKLLQYYNDAIEKGYRFYSYGDAMVII